MLYFHGVEVLTKIGILALKILLLGTLGSIFWPQFRFNDFASALTQTSLASVLAILALFALQALMAALRWRWLLHQLGYPLSVGASVEAWLVGQCVSQIMPAVIGGDAARVIRLRRYFVPTADAVVSVFIDRFAGLVSLVALSAITAPLLITYKNSFVSTEIFWVVGISCLLVGAILGSLRWAASSAALHRIPWLMQAQAALLRIKFTKKALLLFIAVGLGTNMTVIVSAFLLGREINPLMDLYACFAILPLVSLLTFIPISIAGWGLREVLMISAFGLIDAPINDALAISIKLGLANLALGLVGGLVWIVLPARELDANPAGRN